MSDKLLELWRRTKEAMQPLEERLEEAKAKSKQAAADAMSELWTPKMAEDLAEMQKIFAEYDAELRQRVVAGEKIPGAHTSTKKAAVINEAEAIKWAEENDHEEWIEPRTLTKEGRKEIEKAVSDRMHKLYGRIPPEVAEYKEIISANVRVDTVLNPKVKEK
jgi:hypothetical protein